MKLRKSFFIQLIVGSSLLILCGSCYRMPTDNDFSVVPTTNNPAVTGEKNSSFIPAARY